MEIKDKGIILIIIGFVWFVGMCIGLILGAFPIIDNLVLDLIVYAGIPSICITIGSEMTTNSKTFKGNNEAKG